MPCAREQRAARAATSTRPSAELGTRTHVAAGVDERLLGRLGRVVAGEDPGRRSRAPSATRRLLSGSAQARVEDDARRAAAAREQRRVAHGEPRIVGERRADADGDRVVARAQLLHLGARLGAR